jgi:plastocyanin
MNRGRTYMALATATMLGLAGVLELGAWAPTPSAAATQSMPAGMVMAHQPSSSQSITKMLHRSVVRIAIRNFAFGPTKIEISPGTRIIWTNNDSDPHTVTSVKHIWASDALDTSNTFSRTFRTTGSFAYFCTIHPFMHGMVIVKK